MVFPLGKATLIVGRGDDSQIQLPDESISTNHASIIYENGHFVLQDNGSLNGSFVNGVPVTRQPLKHRDMVRFGQYLFMVDLEDETPTPVNPAPVTNVETAAEQVRITRNEANTRTNVEFRPKVKDAGNTTARRITLPHLAHSVPRPRLKIMLTAPVTVNRQQDRYALLSYVFGLMGPICFIPAIIFGHLCPKASGDLASKRVIGMALGYLFLGVWFVVGLYYLGCFGDRPRKAIHMRGSSAQSVQVNIPPVSDALGLLQGDLLWCPPMRVVQEALASAGRSSTAAAKTSFKGADGTEVLEMVRSVWMNGLIVFEPEILRVTLGDDLRSGRCILEDYRSNPTFLQFNSTVVPVKKNVAGPFIIPNLDYWTFFQRDRSQPVSIARFDRDDIPWSGAFRGIEFALDEMSPDVQNKPDLLRCCMLLRPSTAPCRLVINTREGNEQKDWDKSYTCNLYPAEFVGFFFYHLANPSVLKLQLNPVYFRGEVEEKAGRLIRQGLSMIVSNRPASSNYVGARFRLALSATEPAKRVETPSSPAPAAEAKKTDLGPPPSIGRPPPPPPPAHPGADD
jgi:hypothetical protein